MNTVHVESVLHRGVRRIKLEFKFDPDIINFIKVIDGARWSATKQCWHLPYTDTSINRLRSLIIEGYITVPEMDFLNDERKYRYFDKKVSENKEQKLMEFKMYLETQRYSSKTIEVYVDSLKTFMGYFKDREIDELRKSDLMEFNVNYILKNQFSVSYQNQIISAIKLFYRIIFSKEADFDQIERPFRGRILPEIFSQEEVECMLKSIRNLKHRTMLALIYACGLRRGELINLRLNAIDSKRRMLKIRGGKGNRDRLVPLPESLIEHLRQYYKIYRPAIWLFEGNEKGRQYSETSLREIFNRAKDKAGITKKLTLHSLRHSYATHLLENGVDLRFIQELLGHKSSKTTEIYTHVTSKSIEKIKSPFENLNL